jgi:indolepyruvate decarboxylase
VRSCVQRDKRSGRYPAQLPEGRTDSVAMTIPNNGPFTIARYLVTRLREIGIEHVFTIPGDYCAPFLDVRDATPGIERVPNLNELGCGYAADGYARLKGAAAACVQYGVGTFSLLNCVAGSFVEFAPVAIISSSPGASSRLLEEHQNILFHHSTGDLLADQDIFRKVTVASVVIVDAGSAPAEIDRALTQMITQRRPVYIEVINSAWNEVCVEPSGKLAAIPSYSDPASLQAAVEATLTALRSAQRPAFLLGVELQRFGLQKVAQELVKLTQIPFTTTSLGKTALDESQALVAGTYAGPASPLGSGPTLVEVVIPEHDLAPQLKRLAEPPPTLRRYRRAEKPAIL